MTEVMSGWDSSSTKKTNLDSGATFKQVKAMFIAMCQAVEIPGSSVPTPPTPEPSPPSAPESPDAGFEDGFESGGTGAWNTTFTTSGESVSAGRYTAHDGSYSARFTASGTSSGVENAYLYKDTDLTDVVASGYVRVSSSSSTWLRDDGDRFYVIRLSDGSQTLAMAGVRRQGGSNGWELYAKGSYVTATKTVNADTWYCVEVRYDAAQRLAELYIDGAKVLQLTVNSGGAAATHADFGVISSTNVQDGLTVYGDSFSISG
jgi:hypothetical protein